MLVTASSASAQGVIDREDRRLPCAEYANRIAQNHQQTEQLQRVAAVFAGAIKDIDGGKMVVVTASPASQAGYASPIMLMTKEELEAYITLKVLTDYFNTADGIPQFVAAVRRMTAQYRVMAQRELDGINDALARTKVERGTLINDRTRCLEEARAKATAAAPPAPAPPPPSAPPGPPSAGDGWYFYGIVGPDAKNPHWPVTATAAPAGGTVTVAMNGDTYKDCPGESETATFEWTVDGTLAHEKELAFTITATGTTAANCKGKLSSNARVTISANGAAGIVPAELNARGDASFYATASIITAQPHLAEQGAGRLALSDGRAAKARNGLAWFYVGVATRAGTENYIVVYGRNPRGIDAQH